MVDFPVLALIGADIEEQVSHGAVSLRHLPVIDGNLRSFKLLPLRYEAGVDIVNLASIRYDGLLFQVPDKSVNGARAKKIGKEQSVAPNSLGPKYHQAHEEARLDHL